jgi:hypothetical protein
MRMLRNIVLGLFAMLAFATTAEVAIRADSCSDVRDISQCSQCGGGQRPVGVCYSFSNNCSSFTECGGGTGPSSICVWGVPNEPQAGENIWFCECAACPI